MGGTPTLLETAKLAPAARLPAQHHYVKQERGEERKKEARNRRKKKASREVHPKGYL